LNDGSGEDHFFAQFFFAFPQPFFRLFAVGDIYYVNYD